MKRSTLDLSTCVPVHTVERLDLKLWFKYLQTLRSEIPQQASCVRSLLGLNTHWTNKSNSQISVLVMFNLSGVTLIFCLGGVSFVTRLLIWLLEQRALYHTHLQYSFRKQPKSPKVRQSYSSIMYVLITDKRQDTNMAINCLILYQVLGSGPLICSVKTQKGMRLA